MGDPVSSFRFYVHEEPHPFAGWHYHPEYELRLVLRTSGRFVLGDAVGAYGPGQLVLIGPNIPHHWIADRGDRVVDDAHAVLHFSDAWIRSCQSAVPELRALDALLNRSARGIEFEGTAASDGALALMGLAAAGSGMDRAVRVLDTLRILAERPAAELRPITRPWSPDEAADADLVSAAVDHILANLTTGVRLRDAARQAAMSDSAFSRHFKAASGQTFSDMVRRLRLAQASRLLQTTNDPVATIAGAVGYSNLSNFNRQFRRTYGTTPSAHRAAVQTQATERT